MSDFTRLRELLHELRRDEFWLGMRPTNEKEVSERANATFAAILAEIDRLAQQPRARSDGGAAPELIQRLEALGEDATEAPWAWAQTAEKGYGVNIGAGCFAEADEDCRSPLAGDLSHREDDYSVDRSVAELGNQQAAPDAALIVELRNALPTILAALRSFAGAGSPATPGDTERVTAERNAFVNGALWEQSYARRDPAEYISAGSEQRHRARREAAEAMYPLAGQEAPR